MDRGKPPARAGLLIAARSRSNDNLSGRFPAWWAGLAKFASRDQSAEPPQGFAGYVASLASCQELFTI